MKIVLTRDLKGPNATKHGYIEGASFDWPRSVITSISKQEGSEKEPDDSWFRFSTEVERSMIRNSMSTPAAEDTEESEDESDDTSEDSSESEGSSESESDDEDEQESEGKSAVARKAASRARRAKGAEK